MICSVRWIPPPIYNNPFLAIMTMTSTTTTTIFIVIFFLRGVVYILGFYFDELDKCRYSPCFEGSTSIGNNKGGGQLSLFETLASELRCNHFDSKPKLLKCWNVRRFSPDGGCVSWAVSWVLMMRSTSITSIAKLGVYKWIQSHERQLGLTTDMQKSDPRSSK